MMRTLRLPLAGTMILVLLAGSVVVVSAQTDEATFTHPVSGGLVYGDPEGRFTLPLVGEWTAIETDDSRAHFRLADPSAELHVVPLPAADMTSDADAALAAVGLDSQDLSLVEQGRSRDFPGWETFVFARADGQVVGVLQRQLDEGAVALVGVGDLSALGSANTLLTIHGFTEIPIAEYLARSEPSYPTTVADIEDLDSIEFFSSGTRMTGRLHLPDGEGPFPVIVGTHGSGHGTRWAGEFVPVTFLVDAGFAVFNYDKRGVDDSEGTFVEVGTDTGEWRLPQLADDALAAAAFLGDLAEIDPARIGLMGGSQAGWVNPLAASRSEDLAFVVSVVGPTVTVGEEVYYSDLTGGSPRLPKEMTDQERQRLSDQLATYEGERGYDPRPAIEAMSIPGLWVWGERDGSIPTAESRAILEDVISEHGKDFTILSYPDAGHHIAHSVYQADVADWIEAQFEG